MSVKWLCDHICRLDYCGIALLTMGSFVPWLYYSFYCRLVPKLVYFIAIFILGTFCIVVSMWDKFAEPRFRPLRAGILCTFKSLNLDAVKLLSSSLLIYQLS